MADVSMRRSARLWAPLVVLALGLTACTGDSGRSAGGGVPDSEVSDEAVDAEPAVDDEGDDEEDEPSGHVALEEDDPDGAGAEALDQCVAGFWQQDNEHFRTYLVSLADDPAFADSIEVNGSSYLRFDADGTFQRFFEDFGMSMSVPDRVVTISNSAWEGQYGVVPADEDESRDFLWMAETENTVADDVFTVGEDAIEIHEHGDSAHWQLFDHVYEDGPSVGRDLLETLLPVTCTDDVLTLDFGEHTLSWHRAEPFDS